MDLGLSGRACAVTGASRGIGRETARQLCAEGANVLLIARDASALDDAATECAAAGGGAATLALDVTEPDAGERIVAAAEERFGALDVLVNNAGTARWRPLEEVPEADWQAAWELNVMAPLRAMKAAAPRMRERGWGRIVNVGSTATVEPNPSLGLSNAHRMAAVGFFKTLAREVAGEGITVNTIATGRISTQRLAELAGGSIELVAEQAREEVPAGRLGTPEEYGDLVAFLCSERASYLTGAVIPLDGGLLRSV